MGKEGFEGLRSLSELFGRLLQGETLTAKSIAKELGIGTAAATRRLEILATLPHVREGKGRERSIRLPPIVENDPVGEGAVAAACLVSALATAVQDTTIERQVARLRDLSVRNSRSAYPTASLDRKFWFVVRGGEKALPKAESRLGQVIDALLKETMISFDYVRFDGRQERSIRAQPLTLALHEHQFYVVARQAGEDPYPFRFSRMTNLRAGKKVPFPEEGEYHPKRSFQSAFGIFIGQPGEAVQQVRLRFAPKWRSYITSHRWHGTQTERPPAQDGSIEVTLETRVCPELRAWILGFGPDVEVLHPPSLREETRAALERAAAVYRSGATPGVTGTARKGAANPERPRALRRAAR